MNARIDRGGVMRPVLVVMCALLIYGALLGYDGMLRNGERQEHLYFPSGRFLKEAVVGFREAAADYLWFRFIQYYGAFAKGHNDMRYFDLLVDAITRLDPRFVEAYHFASLVAWSDLGSFPKSIDLLKRGVLHNPDNAKLPFQIGFTYYVFYKDYPRASMWFEAAARCSDATDREVRFAAFARHKAGDERVSLELWKALLDSTDNPQMIELARKMIREISERLAGAGIPVTEPAFGPPAPEVTP